MASRKIKEPKWWKNTYFWVSGILVIVALVGLATGPETIRDPGQTDEGGLVWIYLGGAVVMFVNGWLSHRWTVKQFEESA